MRLHCPTTLRSRRQQRASMRRGGAGGKPACIRIRASDTWPMKWAWPAVRECRGSRSRKQSSAAASWGWRRPRRRRKSPRAQRQYESQQLRVLNDVRSQFYNVVVAQRTMQQNAELVHLAEQGLKIANDLEKGLQVSHIDVLQARVELSSTRVSAELARNRYVALWRRLAATLGAPEMQPLPLASDFETALPELSWDESLVRVLAASPEVAAARADVARATWALRRARAEPIPDLNVMASVQHDNDGGDDVANLQIMVPVPLHDKNQGAIRAAEAELRMTRAEVARVELQLQTRLAAAFERYANAREQVARYSHDILPDARKSLELVTRAYRAGRVSLPHAFGSAANCFTHQPRLLDRLGAAMGKRHGHRGLVANRQSASHDAVVPHFTARSRAANRPAQIDTRRREWSGYSVGLRGSGSILPRSVVMQRSTEREVTMIERPQTLSMMSLRVRARFGRNTKYASMRYSLVVSGTSLPPRVSLCEARSNWKSPKQCGSPSETTRRRRNALARANSSRMLNGLVT